MSHIQAVRPRTPECSAGRDRLPALRAHITRILRGTDGLTAISLRLAEAMVRRIAEEPSDESALFRILATLEKPRHYRDGRALQQDAIELALKAFGGSGVADALVIFGDDSGLARVRLQEDALIEHDARSIPGWMLKASDVTGRALLRRPTAKVWR